MLDTVILMLPRDQVKDIQPKHGPSRQWDLYSRTSQYQKHVRNPTGFDRAKCNYMPRITGIQRKVGNGVVASYVKLEFSVPKLIYGNNLDEVTQGDFRKVIGSLRKKLLDSGLDVKRGNLINASVSAFHPSKNIPLSDGYTASLVTDELSKINLNKKFDLDKTSFRNNGKSLQAHTISHSLVFYDKVADLAQRKKKAIDKDQTPQQKTLFAQIQQDSPGLEIVRLEVRLSQKQKLNSVMEKLGFQKNPTFRDIFKKDVCQKIVQFYWDTLVEGENLFLFSTETNPKTLLKRVLTQHSGISPKEAIYLVGLNTLSNQEGGIRDLRSILETRISQRGWYRFADGLKVINGIKKESQLHSWVYQVRECIKSFKPYRTRPP